MTSSPGSAVELLLGKIGAGLAQDLVGLPQFTHLALERLDLFALFRGRPGLQTQIALGLANPVEKRLVSTADLLGNPTNRSPLGAVLMLLIQHHPNRSFLDLRRISRWLLVCSTPGSIHSKVGASGKVGTAQDHDR